MVKYKACKLANRRTKHQKSRADPEISNMGVGGGGGVLLQNFRPRVYIKKIKI